MSRAPINGLHIAYEVHGSGTPLLLIGGLGGTMEGWRPDLPLLTPSHQVIMFDNRGAGRSDVPPPPYSMADLAADAVGLLDYLGIARTHVYGVSMGGMIAQHIALRYPERVLGLVLGCTTPGGDHHVMAGPETMIVLDPSYRQGRTLEERLWDTATINFSPGFRAANPASVEAYVRRGLELVQDPLGYEGQFAACADHSVHPDLGRITAPTLVIHGDADQLIPVENGRLIAAEIPGATLVELAGAGHCYGIEQQHESLRLVLEFLASVDATTGALQAR